MSAAKPIDLTDCATLTWASDQADLPPLEYKALGRLARLAGAHGAVCMSQADLAADFRMTPRSVVTALAGLSERGLIHRKKGKGGGRGKGRAPDFIVLALHNANFSQCNDFTEMVAQCKVCEVQEKPEKSTESGRGVTSPAPRARGLDKPLEVSSSSLFGSYEPQREQCSPVPPILKKGRGGKREYPADFDVIWKLWPAPIRANSDKGVAFDRWRLASAHHAPEAILAAAKRYLAATSVNDAQGGPWKPRTCLAEVFFTKKLESSLEAVADAATQPTRKVWSPEAGAFVEECSP